jgi:hypothetical protein
MFHGILVPFLQMPRSMFYNSSYCQSRCRLSNYGWSRMFFPELVMYENGDRNASHLVLILNMHCTNLWEHNEVNCVRIAKRSPSLQWKNAHS